MTVKEPSVQDDPVDLEQLRPVALDVEVGDLPAHGSQLKDDRAHIEEAGPRPGLVGSEHVHDPAGPEPVGTLRRGAETTEPAVRPRVRH